MREAVIAALAARRGGEVIRRYAGARQPYGTKSGPTDLVTLVDREAEAAIRKVIGEAFADHAILGEEEGGPEAGAEHLWLVDPLDGTNNFVQMLPYYCVSIAYARRGELKAAAVYDPTRDELFTATAGGGASLNGRPLSVDPAERLADGIVSTRTPFTQGEIDNLPAYARVAPQARSMRNLGAAALELAYVAAGRLTAYWEMALNPWDRAAGALLAAEAGGRVTLPDGRPLPLLSRCGVLCSNGRVHDQLLTLVREPD